jgi:murein DD-endopeptidase MepM/ murein hydrolase activator NlpD
MRSRSLRYFALLLTYATWPVAAQPTAPPPFISPLDIALDLTGNFMELRQDHFHSGLDIRTQQREGLPVRAIADGWVSRIRVQPYGYGKALYIDHPNGTTSVYGHLQRYDQATSEVVLNAQYAAKDFSVDVPVERDLLPVKQGQVVAWSGNSGSSGGPHLHFEVRTTTDQVARDPEAYGIHVADDQAPVFLGVRLYPLDSTSAVAPYPARTNGLATTAVSAGRFTLRAGLQARAYGTVGIGVHAIDRYRAGGNACGVRSLTVWVDGEKAFSTVLDHVDFDLQRYANSYMDHGLFRSASQHYTRCYKLPNNKLALYGTEPMAGRITLAPGTQRAVRIVATDANGHETELEFTLVGATKEQAKVWPQPARKGERLDWNSENRIGKDGLRMVLPPLALYEETELRYSKAPPPAGAYAPLHKINDENTPLHLHATLAIAPLAMPTSLRPKALLVRYEHGGKKKAVGGTWDGDFLSAKVRSFGSYTIHVDTLAPRIAPVDLRADMRGRKAFGIKVTDDLSGVERYEAFLNDQWIVMDYDPKRNLLTHAFDKHSEGAGQRNFQLRVWDERGNLAQFAITFLR